jgi:glycosyltransferase involved in cell wall biosynthesis
MGGGNDRVKTFVLTAYPPSGAYLARLEKLAGGDLEIVTVSELRRLSAAGLLRRLRSLEGRCLLPVEDPSSTLLLPILEAIAALTRARVIDIVDRDLETKRRSRLAALRGLADLAAASLDARLALRDTQRELDELLRAPRMPASLAGRRLLFLNTNLWFGLKAGGSIAHVAGVVNALAERAYEVTLATGPDPVGVGPAAVIEQLAPPRQFGLPVDANLYLFQRAVDKQVLQLPRPDLLYQRNTIGSYTGAAIARRLGVPFVLEYNGSEVWVTRHWGRPLRREGLAVAAEEASLRHAHLVVTVSRALHDELVDRGVEPERVVWHANGVDAELFDPARFGQEERQALRERYGIAEDAVVATFVGTFGRWHGVDVLGQAVRLLAEREPERLARSRLHFLLVGDGLKMPEVRARVAGLDSLVTFSGLMPQSEVPLHLAASDVVVSPHVPNPDGSPFFGSPTKLFEYMAAGKAIVASDLEQIGDVLRDGLALLVRPGDAADLARGLLEVAEDGEHRAVLGRLARRRVLERYTWDHHVAAILERLEAVVGSGGANGARS